MNLNEICLEIGTLPHQVGKTLLTNAVKHRVEFAQFLQAKYLAQNLGRQI